VIRQPGVRLALLSARLNGAPLALQLRMAKSLRKGDKVAWDSSGGTSVGRVEKKVTSQTRIKSHVAKASKTNPQYVVRSDKSGRKAVHKASELRKRSG
jgi:hypothetical protein